jgi:hypothetical protein
MRWVPFLSLCALAACGGTNPTAPTTPPEASSPAAPTPAPSPSTVVLRSAQIRGANGHSAAGTAEIVRAGTAHSLELRSDFRIDSGNTDVYLARGGNTVDMGSDLNLGSLRSLTGAQSYPMPDDGAQYRYVILWCRPFRIPIGVGELVAR